MKIQLFFAAALAAAPLCAAENNALFLSYFKGNGEAGVYLAMSEDGRTFHDLNDGKPVFAPPKWPNQDLTRDPSIVFHEGKFHMTWTSHWNGRVFGYATSPDLKTWSEPVKVQPFPASLPPEEQPQNVWAPEIHWDPVQKNFLILFSTTTPRQLKNGDGGAHNLDHRIYATRTADGRQFSDAKLFFDPGHSVIDAFLGYDTDRWVMIAKHEKYPQHGGKNLRVSFAPRDFSKPFPPLSAPIIGPGSPIRPHEKAEGPSLLKNGDEWLLYWDAFENGHYGMASTKDFVTWTDHSDNIKMPKGVRHGTIFRAPRAAVAFTK